MIDKETAQRVLRSLEEENLRFAKTALLSSGKIKRDYEKKAADMVEACEIVRWYITAFLPTIYQVKNLDEIRSNYRRLEGVD